MRSSILAAGASRWWRAVPGLALLLGLLVLSAGWGEGPDRALREVRDGLRSQAASGEIVLVEIDKKSLRALDQWPWPRRHHAGLVDRLAASGADLIAFDVNFEVASNPEDDAALAAALERASGLVALPTFEERVATGSSEIVENLPYSAFRDFVFLAGVRVLADSDGLVRTLPLGTFTAGTPRPSMASLLAEPDSVDTIDRVVEIDFSINPESIPRLSYVDVLEGRFDRAAVEGKRLFIGGTAADMEDRYAVPRHGVLPGVLVQALAAETILAGGVPVAVHGLWPLLLAFALTLLAARPRRPVLSGLVLAGGTLALLALPLATEEWISATFPVVPAIVSLLAAALGVLTLAIGDEHRRRSLLDTETGLPNLKALVERVPSARTIVVARIDRFEALAATLGARATANLVQRVADRLAAETGETVYRTDEHSLAWADARDAAVLEEVLGAVVAAMRAPVDCGRRVDVTLGLGLAEWEHSQELKQQVANAALAAERAMHDRRPFLHFADAQDEESGWHLSLLSELSAAMEAGEVWNAYQPKLDIRTGRVCGVETLVRWTHRERGFVGPDRFIPVVEANGRAAELTAHVFGQALQDAARWRAAGHALTVAVNVSATLLEDHDFIAWLGETLRTSPVPAEAVTVEVTESAAMTDIEQAIAALAHWRSLGVAISIDDYGTGQSSLGYLQRLPAGELKIDKSFVQNITQDSRDAIMVRSTVALAHQLGMKVVAEGIEDEPTLALLRELDCDVAQGYLIGKPMPAAALEAFLADEAKLAA